MSRPPIRPAMMCPLCGGIIGLEENKLKEHAFIEGFMLGVLTQRITDYTKVSLTSTLCAPHLGEIRKLADMIPNDLIAPPHRATLLNFGLSAVPKEG